MAPRNCGLVTFLNNNKTRTTAEAARTLAHEVIMMPTMLMVGGQILIMQLRSQSSILAGHNFAIKNRTKRHCQGLPELCI